MLNPAAHLAEPVPFAGLRVARTEEASVPEAQFDTLPLLPTPADLWQQATELGPACRRIGRTVLCFDLLLVHHDAELVSFDADFDAIASVSALRLHRLTRPV